MCFVERKLKLLLIIIYHCHYQIPSSEVLMIPLNSIIRSNLNLQLSHATRIWRYFTVRSRNSPLLSSKYPSFSLFSVLVLLPTLFSSSMMVARLLLWLAWDSVPGQTGAGDDTVPEVLTPECGNKLVREREAATAPHSCKRGYLIIVLWWSIPWWWPRLATPHKQINMLSDPVHLPPRISVIVYIRTDVNWSSVNSWALTGKSFRTFGNPPRLEIRPLNL